MNSFGLNSTSAIYNKKSLFFIFIICSQDKNYCSSLRAFFNFIFLDRTIGVKGITDDKCTYCLVEENTTHILFECNRPELQSIKGRAKSQALTVLMGIC